jgi:hypothetical protein
MTNLKKVTASAVAAASLLANMAMPLAAETTIEIIGNGTGSDNFATVNQTTTTTVTQSNTANVTNDVDAYADTGSNSAMFNTGGAVGIGTGDATSDVDVTNTLNSNAAQVDCCDVGDTNVVIAENGAFSTNDVKLRQLSRVDVDQDNLANVTNNVDAGADSGYNTANMNTGADVLISTGKAKADVAVSTTANSNVAMVGNPLGALVAPKVSLEIIGNGVGSDNFITANLQKAVVLDQDNLARVANDVDAYAGSGDNQALFNTGGIVGIGTGNAAALVDVDNMVNFNYASIDCGCTWDVHAKIAGNGAEIPWWWHHDGPKLEGFDGFPQMPCLPIMPCRGDNVINLTLGSRQLYGQDNLARLYNDITGSGGANAYTGYNEASMNTGDPGADPWIMTGAALSDVDVYNSGNVNTIGGEYNPWWWPYDLFPADAQFSFDMAAFYGWFSGYFGA